MGNMPLRGALLLGGLVLYSAMAQADLVAASTPAAGWAPAVIDAAMGQAVPAAPAVEMVQPLAVNPGGGGAVVATSPLLVDIGLWRFINSVRAQQTGTPLIQLESNLTIVVGNTVPAISAVPLPGADGLMALGLLGLLGLKARSRRAGRAQHLAARSPLATMSA